MLHIIRGISVAALVLVSGAAFCAPGDGPTGEEGSTVPMVPAVNEVAQPTASTGDASAEEPAVVAPKQVYKSVDAKGNIIFTDSPPTGRPSEAVVVQPVNSMPLGASPAPPAKYSETGEGDAENKKGPVSYTRLEITSPTNDEVMGQEVESATIAAVLEPGLQEGHTVQLYFDGKPVGDGSLSYSVSPLDRGTHTAQAKVFDSKGKVVKASGIVQFHVRRISSLNKVSEQNAVPQKRPSLLATLLGRGNTKPPAEPASGFGSMNGFGSQSGSNAIADTKTGTGVRSAGDVRATRDAR